MIDETDKASINEKTLARQYEEDQRADATTLRQEQAIMSADPEYKKWSDGLNDE